jgi:SAM-dependent methyltransferase
MTTTDARHAPEVLNDEMLLIRQILETAGRRIAEIGCGGGAFARRLALEGGAASVAAIDLPEALPAPAGNAPPQLRFLAGAAQDLPLADRETDLVFMMKSLHHVPVDSMDRALLEVARVLVSGGVLYVSEPVAEGKFNDILRNFHDETHVRREAQEALRRCKALRRKTDIVFLAPCNYRDFDDFERRMMHGSTVTTRITEAIRDATLRTYERHAAADGSFFENRPFHVTVLRKPAG